MHFLLDVVIWFSLVVPNIIGGADKCSSGRYMGNFFPKVGSDYSRITWAHGVNSKEHLTKSIKDDSMMLEADISLGTVEGISDKIQPIMAHPPAMQSDITLSEWLDEVIKFRAKGIKLDFKSTDVLEPSFLIIKQRYSEMSFPVWINADILPGPVMAKADPVDPKVFLQLCKLHLPLSTISPGWTTFANPSVDQADKKMSWKHVHDMAMTLRDGNVTQPATFPVRAAFVGASMEPLEWLVDAVPHSSLTVWSGSLDDVDVNDLLVLRKAMPRDKVYYDLPSSLNEQFLALKDRLENVEHNTVPYFPKTLFTMGMENNGSVIVAARTMILCGTCSAEFNCPPLGYGPAAGFEVFSAVIEFPDTLSSSTFDFVVFRFVCHNGPGKIEILKGREIRFWDGPNLVQSQEYSSDYKMKVSILLGPAHNAKQVNASVLFCLQPVFSGSKTKESNAPTTCQEILVARSGPLFTIDSQGHGIKVLKDLRYSEPTSQASSVGRQSGFLNCFAPVIMTVLLSGLFLR